MFFGAMKKDRAKRGRGRGAGEFPQQSPGVTSFNHAGGLEMN